MTCFNKNLDNVPTALGVHESSLCSLWSWLHYVHIRLSGQSLVPSMFMQVHVHYGHYASSLSGHPVRPKFLQCSPKASSKVICVCWPGSSVLTTTATKALTNSYYKFATNLQKTKAFFKTKWYFLKNKKFGVLSHISFITSQQVDFVSGGLISNRPRSPARMEEFWMLSLYYTCFWMIHWGW